VLDTRANGSQAQGEDVFPDMGVVTANSFSFQFMAQNANRFRILRDTWFVLQPAIAGTDGANTVSTCSQARDFKFTYKFKKPLRVATIGTSTTPTTAALENYNVFLLAHTDNASAPAIMTGCARAYYHE